MIIAVVWEGCDRAGEGKDFLARCDWVRLQGGDLSSRMQHALRPRSFPNFERGRLLNRLGCYTAARRRLWPKPLAPILDAGS
jgi:hypothetical protein